MNRDQVKGTAKDIAGKVQETVGQVTGNTSQQVKGVAKQVEGKVQKGIGDIKEAAKDIEKRPARNNLYPDSVREDATFVP